MKERLWNYFNKYKWYAILIFIILVFLALYIIFKPKKINEEIIIKEESIEIKEDIKEEVKEKIEKKTIKVDIKGAVNNPGVYELKLNSRVGEAINESGGLTINADTSIINLSKVLEDQMVVIIYTKDEIKEMKKGTTTVKYVEKECICPKIENNACIENPITNKEESNKSAPTKEESNKTNDKPENVKININTASINELTSITGIGESKANAIIEYRTKNGLFKSIEALKDVSGIGDVIFEKIKNNITI